MKDRRVVGRSGGGRSLNWERCRIERQDLQHRRRALEHLAVTTRDLLLGSGTPLIRIGVVAVVPDAVSTGDTALDTVVAIPRFAAADGPVCVILQNEQGQHPDPAAPPDEDEGSQPMREMTAPDLGPQRAFLRRQELASAIQDLNQAEGRASRNVPNQGVAITEQRQLRTIKGFAAQSWYAQTDELVLQRMKTHVKELLGKTRTEEGKD